MKKFTQGSVNRIASEIGKAAKQAAMQAVMSELASSETQGLTLSQPGQFGNPQWQPTFHAPTESSSSSGGNSQSTEAFLVQIVLPTYEEAETAENALRERGGQPTTQKITIASSS